MPRIFIGGKIVEVTREELAEYLPLADATAPDTPGRTIARQTRPQAARPSETLRPPSNRAARGDFDSLPVGSQRLLVFLASIHPRWATESELRTGVGVEDQRGLGGLLVGISRRLGRNVWVEQEITRRGNERSYRYRLTARALRAARDEGWATSQQTSNETA